MIDTNFESVRVVKNFVNNFISDGFYANIEINVKNFYTKTLENAEKLYNYAKLFYDLSIKKQSNNIELVKATKEYISVLDEKLKMKYLEQKILKSKLKLYFRRNKFSNNQLYKNSLQNVNMTILSYEYEIKLRKKILTETENNISKFNYNVNSAQKFLVSAKNIKLKCESELAQVLKATKNEIFDCFEILREKIEIASNFLNDFCLISNMVTQCGFSSEGKICVKKDDIIFEMNNVKNFGIALEDSNNNLLQYSKQYYSNRDVVFDGIIKSINQNLNGIEFVNSEFKDIYLSLKKMKNIITSYDKINF